MICQYFFETQLEQRPTEWRLKKGQIALQKQDYFKSNALQSPTVTQIITYFFKGDFLTEDWFLISPAPSEPLLCKFADGGQKKRQNQSKYTQNGRPWPREGEVSPGWLVLRKWAADVPQKSSKTSTWGPEEIGSHRKPNGFTGGKGAGLC